MRMAGLAEAGAVSACTRELAAVVRQWAWLAVPAEREEARRMELGPQEEAERVAGP